MMRMKTFIIAKANQNQSAISPFFDQYQLTIPSPDPALPAEYRIKHIVFVLIKPMNNGRLLGVWVCCRSQRSCCRHVGWDWKWEQPAGAQWGFAALCPITKTLLGCSLMTEPILHQWCGKAQDMLVSLGVLLWVWLKKDLENDTVKIWEAGTCPWSPTLLFRSSVVTQGETTKTCGYEQAGACAALLLRALIVLLEIPLATATRVTYSQNQS